MKHLQIIIIVLQKNVCRMKNSEYVLKNKKNFIPQILENFESTKILILKKNNLANATSLLYL